MLLNKVGEQKLFKLFGLFSIVFFLNLHIVNAKSFAEFKNSQVKSSIKYKDEKDNIYSKYLKQKWYSYNIYISKPMYKKAKSKNIPSLKEKQIKSVGPTVSITIGTSDLNTTLESNKIPTKDINFDFYGSKLSFNIPNNFKEVKFYPQNQDGIKNSFNTMASSDYENLISEITKVSDFMNLNDWGIYLLVEELSKQINPNQDNLKLLSWFILNKLGYIVKIGLANRHVVLLQYSKDIIYSTPYYLFNDKRFYILSEHASSMDRIYSFAQNYPKANKALDFSLKSLPKFSLNLKEKNLSFKDYGKKYTILLKYNQNIVDFMSTYPNVDYKLYFQTPLDNVTYHSIATSLKKYIDTKKAGDAINFILHFVQKAFKYEIDANHFTKQKTMFAYEALYYDKSDCEDKTILFSYLIKKLFGINIVGIKYKDHMASAINIPINGDNIKIGSRKLIIADPSYINANIGQSIPQYKKLKEKGFVTIKKN